MRQGFPLSPGLFNLLIVDLVEVFRKSGWGGVRIGQEEVYVLVYADNIVLLGGGKGNAGDDIETGEILTGKEGGTKLGRKKDRNVRQGKP